jgi:AcrR family transcriptional regulator
MANVTQATEATGGTGVGPAVAEPAAVRQLLSRSERRASVLAAAATAFARTGFAATSMEDVAAAAGVTRLIVYRHFSSKEDLYRAVLTDVAARLGEEFARFLSLPEGARHGFATRSILTVARENPDGYRLLMVHAAREPQFEELGVEYRQAGFELARSFVRPVMTDPAMAEWAARSIVEYLNNGVLEWLEVGSADRDEEFVELATAGLIALYTAWADTARASVTEQ